MVFTSHLVALKLALKSSGVDKNPRSFQDTVIQAAVASHAHRKIAISDYGPIETQSGVGYWVCAQYWIDHATVVDKIDRPSPSLDDVAHALDQIAATEYDVRLDLDPSKILASGTGYWVNARVFVESKQVEAFACIKVDFFAAIHENDLGKVRSYVKEYRNLMRCTEPRYGLTPLCLAALYNQLAMIQLLLELGADPNQHCKRPSSYTPLQLCSLEASQLLLRHGALLDPCSQAHLGFAELLSRQLHKNPEHVHMRGGDGRKPIHFARDIETARALIRAGAELDALDEHHACTAAQWALADARLNVARFLIHQGVQSDIFLDVALGRTESVEAYFSHHLKPKAHEHPLSISDDPPPVYHHLMGRGASLLHVAALYNRSHLFELLLSAGLQLDTPRTDGATALHLASYCDHAVSVRRLIELGADPSVSSNHKPPADPLVWAVIGAAYHSVKVLVEEGVRVTETHLGYATAGNDGAFDANRIRFDDTPARTKILALLADNF